MLLPLLSLLTLAPGDTTPAYRKAETKDLSAYRVRIEFADPYAGMQEEKLVDTTPHKLKVVYQMDPGIVRLLQQHLSESAAAVDAEGYRVQIYSSTRADDASRIKLDLNEAYTSRFRVYDFYDRPYFKVRIGDFLSKVDADRLCTELRNTYPGAFVVPDRVRLPR